MKKILIVAGARPNFMKIAPIIRAIKNDSSEKLSYKLVHTGQHYDAYMSQIFFDELGIPKPDFNLNVGSGSHAKQTAEIMVRFEEICISEKPDIVVVVGDVNSTVACGLVAKKLHITLAHIEAGLRSGDRNMPEEINRLVTDSITDLFFVTEPDGKKNLLNEGIPKKQIHFVGHVMIDNLFYQLTQLTDANTPIGSSIKKRLPNNYLALTMHRPSNVDDKKTLSAFLNKLHKISKNIPIVFPVHPRTMVQIKQFKLDYLLTDISTTSDSNITEGIITTDPMGYMDFLTIWKDAKCVITDSGGLQEETTALKIPCITIRDTTERPVTVDVGSNIVIGQDVEKLEKLVNESLRETWKDCNVPELWDGMASKRIMEVLG